MYTQATAFSLKEIEHLNELLKKHKKEKTLITSFSLVAVAIASGITFFISDLLLQYTGRLSTPFFNNAASVILAVIAGLLLGAVLMGKLNDLQNLIDYGSNRLIMIDPVIDYELAKRAEEFFEDHEEYKSVLDEVKSQHRHLLKGELDDLITTQKQSNMVYDIQRIQKNLYG